MNKYNLGTACLNFAGAVIFASLGAAPAKADYEVHDAGQVPYSVGGNLNESDTVCTSSGTLNHACIWSPTGGVNILSTTDYSYGFDINVHGAVVGRDGNQPTLWSPSGTATPLPLLPGTGSFGNASAINDSGLIVGASGSFLNGNNKPCIWKTTTSVQMIPTLGGVNGSAQDINNAGHIVGSSKTASSTYEHAFWWSGSDTDSPIDLTPSYSAGQAMAINAHDHVVGSWGGGAHTPFLWTPTGGLQALTYSGSQCWATGINDSDLIVGHRQLSGSTARRAVLWNGGGSAIDLNTLLPTGSGWILTDAHAVNNQGSILCTGEISGATHTVLLTLPNTELPVLSIQRLPAGTVMLSWDETPGITLQQSDNLSSWSPSGATVTTSGGTSQATINPTTEGPQLYFKLDD